MKCKIILASASKRRSKVLKECGIPHSVVITDAPEKMDHKRTARFNVLHNARLKAEKAAAGYGEGFVIGADTVVLLDPSLKRNSGAYPLGAEKRLIGKPRTAREARSLLNAFSGKTILLYTGLCLIDVKRTRLKSAVDISRVHVKELSRKKIDRFLEIAGPHEKAGGFSIEGPGAFIFDDIEGSFYNILGLPMMKLYGLFEELGVDLLGVAGTRARS